MISEELSARLKAVSPVQLKPEELAEILEVAEVVRGERTAIAGMLRVLDLAGEIFVQEETQDGQILLRSRPVIDEALVFVDSRLAAYERMWDG